MHKTKIRFWGCRGSFPTPDRDKMDYGGDTSCVEIRTSDNQVIILDMGSGLKRLGHKIINDSTYPTQINIFLSHYHWDHICGMPFFQPAFSPNWKIKFFGPGENSGDIEQVLSDQMKTPYSPVETETWMAKIDYLEQDANGLSHGQIRIR